MKRMPYQRRCASTNGMVKHSQELERSGVDPADTVDRTHPLSPGPVRVLKMEEISENSCVKNSQTIKKVNQVKSKRARCHFDLGKV